MTERRPYPSDLSDARWALIAPRLTAWRQARTDAGVSGRTPTHDLRDIFNAILYINRTGIAWRYLPPRLPAIPHRLRLLRRLEQRRHLHRTQLPAHRPRPRPPRPHHHTNSLHHGQPEREDLHQRPTIHTQGPDAGKKIVGRKRGIITDTLGLLLAVTVTAASASDNTIGINLLNQATTTHPTLTKTWVDAGFTNRVVEHGAALGVDVETVTKNPQAKGFSVVKRRWVVERTIGWLMHHRRLVRDYEARPDNSASMITLAMIDNLAKRLTAETTPTWREPLQPQHTQNT
ncbi:IS5 family transposase [Salinispora mooreana]|uniref:IS5 family transposase n=3 Tax=Salinispora mooreana TaxID=999545 RepID=UPI001CC5C113|nr:IS5 family transposase [Salinispora mooreana]